MRTPIALVLVFAIILSACGGRLRDRGDEPSAETATSYAPVIDYEPGLTTYEIRTDDGRDRSFHVFAPADRTTPMALLIAMHGGLGSGMQFRENSGFDDLAEQHGFVVVYPDGISIIGDRDNRVWNGGACCGPAVRRNVDDVGFIDLVIEEISATYPIDPARIYATGHSNGAIMSYRLACELSDTIVAIGFQAGSIEIDDCAPTAPVSVFHLHGLADASIDIDGGQGSGVTDHAFASPRESVEFMADTNGCDTSQPFSDPDNADITGTTWSGCDDGTAVVLMLVDGANHAWMGHPSKPIQQLVSGPPYDDLDASAVIWDFLATRVRD